MTMVTKLEMLDTVVYFGTVHAICSSYLDFLLSPVIIMVRFPLLLCWVLLPSPLLFQFDQKGFPANTIRGG